jgi:hypothetical protein
MAGQHRYIKAHLATPRQREELQPILQLLQDSAEIKLKSDNTEVLLHGSILGVFKDIVENLSSGLAVAVAYSDGGVTMREAHEFLDITKEELLELVEGQIISCEMVDGHRRFKILDLLNYLRNCQKKS